MKNYLNIQQHAMSGYFERVAMESRFYATHISLLMAMFYYSDSDAQEKPFQVSRPMLMRFSRIRSIATYHKNIKDLVEFGYIEYNPSWHPKRGTQIRFIIEIPNLP